MFVGNHDPNRIDRLNTLMLHSADVAEAKAAHKKEQQGAEIKDEFVPTKTEQKVEKNIKRQQDLPGEPNTSLKEIVSGIGHVALEGVKETAEYLRNNAGIIFGSTSLGAPIGAIGGLTIAGLAGAGTLGIALAATTGAGALTVAMYKLFDYLSN